MPRAETANDRPLGVYRIWTGIARDRDVEANRSADRASPAGQLQLGAARLQVSQRTFVDAREEGINPSIQVRHMRLTDDLLDGQ